MLFFFRTLLFSYRKVLLVFEIKNNHFVMFLLFFTIEILEYSWVLDQSTLPYSSIGEKLDTLLYLSTEKS